MKATLCHPRLWVTFYLLLGTFIISSCAKGQASSDEVFGVQVLQDAEKALKAKAEAIHYKINPFDGLDKDSLTSEEQEAMSFLYAYMPLPDIFDHTTQFHLDNVRAALAAKAEQSWGKEMPGYLFRHFVLPLRVNNEVLDDFRTLYYRELNDLVKGMSMTEAVLEVNHWAHQHITYTPSDSRTRPATGTLMNALGRCGEQSVFLVAALRTVGIPARQIYTPRWAHTDNNHAWVEAWVDGEWHYLGASEPAPVLDNAWFDAPVLRAMLLTAYAFGDYKGPEEWLESTSVHTSLNVSDNYITTSTARVRVVNPDGSPAEGAKVSFRLYNYAELYPLVTRVANNLGEASVNLGLGDIVVIATKGDLIAMKEITVTEGQDAIELKLAPWEDLPDTQKFRLTPPEERKPEVLFTPEQEARNSQRMAENTRIRTKYTDTFFDEKEAQAYVANLGLSGADAQSVAGYLVRARGNHKTITDFLSFAKEQEKMEEALLLLATLVQKDLEDIPLTVLKDVLGRDLTEKEWRTPDIIAPRVTVETIYPVQEALDRMISEIAKSSDGFQNSSISEKALLITQKVADFWNDDTYNPQLMAMNPVSTWKLKGGDERSLTVLLVRLLRTAKIPSHYDAANSVVVYRNEKGNEEILPFLNRKEESTEAGCTLDLNYEAKGFLKTPAYFVHYTVNYFAPDGRYGTYEFDDYATLSDLKGERVIYDRNLLSTGTREADGTARYTLTKLPCGIPTSLNFDFDENAVNVIGELNSEALYKDANTKSEKSILSTTGRGYFVVMIVKPNHEPSDHILRDVRSLIGEDGSFPLPVLVLTSKADPTEELKGLLPEATWGTDTQDILAQIAQGTEHEMPLDYPVVVVADTFNRVVFFSQGYTIGIGDRLSEVVHTVIK